jgi:hypothetical protein
MNVYSMELVVATELEPSSVSHIISDIIQQNLSSPKVKIVYINKINHEREDHVFYEKKS